MVAQGGSEKDEEEQAGSSQQGTLPAEAWQLVLAGGWGWGFHIVQSPSTDPDLSKQRRLKVMDREAWQRSKLRAWMGTLGACRDDKRNEWASWTAQAIT